MSFTSLLLEGTSSADPLTWSCNSDRLGALAAHIKPGASVLDKFPPLLHLPEFMNPWKREGRRLHGLELELFMGQYQDVRKRVADGKSSAPSFASKLQNRQKELGLLDEEAAYLCGSLFGAGSDTTASAVSSSKQRQAAGIFADSKVLRPLSSQSS